MLASVLCRTFRVLGQPVELVRPHISCGGCVLELLLESLKEATLT